MFFSKKKSRKTMLKYDLQQIHDVLDYINHTAIRTANMGAEYKKRLMMEGDEQDGAYMGVCDTVTNQLKEAYETMYSIIDAKQQQLNTK